MTREVSCPWCGKEERARIVKSWYDGSRYEAPEGWVKGASVGTIICKECAKKLGEGNSLMDTPDDIKKGLECCSSSLTYCAPVCPYLCKCFAGEVRPVLKEALAYIRQLEEQIEKLEKDVLRGRGEL